MTEYNSTLPQIASKLTIKLNKCFSRNKNRSLKTFARAGFIEGLLTATEHVDGRKLERKWTLSGLF